MRRGSHVKPSTSPVASEVGKLAIITCHFNFAGYDRPVQNLWRFIRQMEVSKLPVFGIEAALENHKFETEGLNGWKQVRISNRGMLFQKEALLNAAERLVPREFSKIAWIDADVWFENPNWFEQTEKALDVVPVVQPFHRAVWQGKRGEIELERESCAYLVATGNERVFRDFHFGHCGFAWAVRREFFREAGGIFDLAPTGSGDVFTGAGLLNVPLDARQLVGVGMSAIAQNEQFRYRNQASHWSGGKCGFVEGRVFHEWHGTRKDRQYSERHGHIKNFDPHRHLRRVLNTWLEWTPAAPRDMVDGIASYFAARKEDGE